MSNQKNDFSRRSMSTMTKLFMPGRRAPAVIAVLLMCASLVFSPRVSAHNINLETAKEKARAYARTVLDNSGKGYVQAITRCVRAFSGHNHYIRCTIQYEDKESKQVDGVFACTETIEVYHQSHRDSINYQYYMKHTSRQCGNERLRGPNP